MTPEDKQFVRDAARRINSIDNYIVRRFLGLLIESEAMRKKAEFLLNPDCPIGVHTFPSSRCKHDWTDANWIEAQRKELVG